MIRGLLLALLGLACAQCVVFRASGQEDAPQDVQEHRFGSVVYEMVNWENQNEENRAGDVLAATLGASAQFERLQAGVGGDEWFVQIILEQLPGNKELGAPILDRPLVTVLRQLNGIAFGQSFFVIPQIQYLDRRVIFAVWRKGQLQKEYVYESDAWVAIGWLSLLAVVPSESAYMKYDMSRVARLFVADAARDGLFASGLSEARK